MGLKERKVNLGCVMRRGRRYLAGALSCALLLGMILPTAAAADTNVNSATAAKPGEQPRIIIESNAVIDDFGDLTGYLEVALHVKTPVLDGVAETFRYLGVSLEYNSEILTPVDWTAPDGITTNDVDLSSTTAESYRDQVRFQTLKTNELTTAIAHVSGPCDGNKSPAKTGLFYIVSEASKPANLSEDTVVAVVRFRYDKSKYQPWEATADQWTDKTSPTWLVRFAPDAISGLAPDSSFVTQQLLYRSGNNAFYYTDDPATTVGYRVEAQGAPAGQEYLTNLLTMGNKGEEKDREVRFTLRNLPTYDPAMRSNFATILYYDYTDRLMGVQTVLPGDARVAINTYVERNFIHPELRASAHKGDANYTDSIDREYSYRGIYPSIDPDTGTTVDDGEDYKLTFKLDYTFYKRKTVGTPTADGTGIEWTTTPMSSVTDPIEKDLPYINGWAVIDDLDDIENVWTTFGTGELGNCDPASGSFTTTGESSYFRFADFSRLENGQVIYVKACYEPGTILKPGNVYSLITEPYYERYGSTATTLGGVYSISFSYARVDGDGYGVSRMREPSVRIDYTPDVEGIAQKAFSVGIDLDNEDILPVTFTPSSALMSMEYSLRDKKPYTILRQSTRTYNFYTGDARSLAGNPAGIMDNFNYEEYHYEDGEFLGSMGFVTIATLNQLLKICSETVETHDMTDINNFITVDTMTDVNLRLDARGTPFDGYTLVDARYLLLDAVSVALDKGKVRADGVADLDWHQLQYHIINANSSDLNNITGGLHKGIPDENSWGAYSWCRLDDCSGGSIAITDLGTLLVSAVDYVYNDNLKAMNQLLDTFYFRTGIKGVEYEDLISFKEALLDAIQLLEDNKVDSTAVLNMTWRQVQYLLDHPGTTAIPAPGAVTEDYWWENGGTKSFADLPDMLTALFNVEYNGYDPSWTENITVDNLRDFLLRADEKGTEFLEENHPYAFMSAMAKALPELQANGYTGGAIGTEETDTALVLQHVMLGNPYKSPAELRQMTADGDINYYWITGAPIPKNFRDVFSIAWQVYEEGMPEDYLSGITVALISEGTSNSGGEGDFWLRATTAGGWFSGDAALRMALRSAISALVTGGVQKSDLDNLTWEQFQHVLLGNAYSSDADPGNGAYWWRGGHKAVTDLSSLLEAAWNSYGGPGGTAAADTTDADAIEALQDSDIDFVNGPVPGVENSGDLYLRVNANGDTFGTMTAFKTALRSAITKVRGRGRTFVQSLTWIELQHLLMADVTNYVDDATLRGTPTIDYWWENGGEKSSEVNIAALIYELSGHISNVYNGNADESTLVDFLTTNIGDLGFQKDDGSSYGVGDIGGLVTSLAGTDGTSIMDCAWASDDIDYFTPDYDMFEFTWAEIQHFLLTGNLVSEESGNLPNYDWSPMSIGFFSMRRLPLVPTVDETVEEVISEDGRTVTTTRTQDIYDAVAGTQTTITTVTVAVTTENTIVTTITTTTTILDLYTGKMTTTTDSKTTVEDILPVQPEEPVCTCGSEDGTHSKDCPLYVAPETPEEPVCTCGSEDGTHSKDCPLYVVPEAPEEPVCTCGSEDGTHSKDCPLYVVPETPEEPVCTCGSEDGTHSKDCPLYVVPEAPEEPVCTCGSEDGTHSSDCPLYEEPKASDEELTDPKVPGTETPDPEPEKPQSTDPAEPNETPEGDDQMEPNTQDQELLATAWTVKLSRRLGGRMPIWSVLRETLRERKIGRSPGGPEVVPRLSSLTLSWGKTIGRRDVA